MEPKKKMSFINASDKQPVEHTLPDFNLGEHTLDKTPHEILSSSPVICYHDQKKENGEKDPEEKDGNTEKNTKRDLSESKGRRRGREKNTEEPRKPKEKKGKKTGVNNGIKPDQTWDCPQVLSTDFSGETELNGECFKYELLRNQYFLLRHHYDHLRKRFADTMSNPKTIGPMKTKRTRRDEKKKKKETRCDTPLSLFSGSSSF